MSRLRLRPLMLDDEQEARAAHVEMAHDAFTFLLDWGHQDPWPEYLEKLKSRRRGLSMPADRVPATFLVAQVGRALVGRASIRHELNDHLAAVGGHVGYGVRPAYHRHGFATEILRQSLIIARAEGVDQVLLTCEEDNRASATVIERFGGVLEDVRPDAYGRRMRRYWIA
jgi:predicted acetyltransferase